MGSNSRKVKPDAQNSTKEKPDKLDAQMTVKVVDGPDKEWWEDYTPCEDSLKQISFIASIGTGFTLSASVTLACSSTFKGATDNSTIALVSSTAEIFAWGGSAYAVALVASMIGILTVEFKSVVKVLQKPKKEHPKAPHWTFFILYVLLAVVSLGFTAAGTALTGIGLNTLAGGSGTMLQWSLLAVGLPMIVLAIVAIPVERHLKNAEHKEWKKNEDEEKNEEKEKIQRLVAMVIHAAKHPVLTD
jgi:hypothetical protein